jgi:hypothetical protein
MIEVAEAISTFGFGLSKDQVQPKEQLLVLTSYQLQVIVSQAIQEATAPLLERIEALEALQELYHGPSPAPEDRPMIRDALDRQRDVQATLPLRVADLEDRAEAGTPQPSSPPARGTKTEARIKKLKEILKARGSSQTFGQLQRDLSLSPSQFSKLVAKLDKRSFQIGKRPRSRFNEKVLGLRAKLYDPI